MKEYGHEYAEHWFYTPTVIERAGGLNIIRSGHNRAKLNYKIGPRFIPYFSMHFVLSGKGTYIYNGDKYSVQRGDVFCLMPNETHEYYTSQEELLKMFWIAFDGRQALPMLAELGVISSKPYVSNILTSTSRDKIQNLISFFETYSDHKQFKKISLVYELFDSIMETSAGKKIVDSTLDNNWVEKAIDYIDMYYSEGITVTNVSEYVGINRTHFTNMFTKKTGTSPKQYLQATIMKRAKEILIKTDTGITEIALSLSYADVYSFSRAFKRYYGTSPSVYRTEYKN